MIGFLRGVLFEKGSGYIIIDVGGVGYEVSVPANSGAYLSSEGEEVMIYTTMIVREDDVSLYGFSRRGELDAFRKLITVNGIGAKAGISILSAFTLEQLQQAIVFEDVKALTKAQRHRQEDCRAYRAGAEGQVRCRRYSTIRRSCS